MEFVDWYALAWLALPLSLLALDAYTLRKCTRIVVKPRRGFLTRAR